MTTTTITPDPTSPHHDSIPGGYRTRPALGAE